VSGLQAEPRNSTYTETIWMQWRTYEPVTFTLLYRIAVGLTLWPSHHVIRTSLTQALKIFQTIDMHPLLQHIYYILCRHHDVEQTLPDTWRLPHLNEYFLTSIT